MLEDRIRNETADQEAMGAHDQGAPNISVGKAIPFPNTTVVFIMGEVDHGVGLLMWSDRKGICSASSWGSS